MMKDNKEASVLKHNDLDHAETKCNSLSQNVTHNEEVRKPQKSAVIVNDILSFAYSKINNTPRYRLIKYLQEFYLESDAFEAYKLLTVYLPSDRNVTYAKIGKTDPFLSIYMALKYLCINKNNQLFFLFNNFNNTPQITNVKKVTSKKRKFIMEHEALKCQISELCKCLYKIREQFFQLGLCNKTPAVGLTDYDHLNKSSNKPVPCQPLTKQLERKKDFSYLQQLVDEDNDINTEETFIHGVSTWKNVYIEKGLPKEIQHSTIRKENIDFSEIKMKFEKENLYTEASKKHPLHTCFTCMRTFKSASSLKFHRDSIHRFEKRKYQCPLCTNTFSKDIWMEHVRLCAGNSENILTQEDIHCKICDIFYSDEKLLKNHKAFHDQSRPFECYECKFRFYSQKTVEDHYKIHAIEKKENSFKCPFCSRKFLFNNKLEEHIRTHTGERPFKCLLCNFSCSRLSGLKAHSRTHTEKKEFECDICGRRFKLKTKLTVHKKVHSSHRPFKCPECGKGFKTGREMTSHHRNHLGIRNHPCPYCNYKAVNASVLRGHINVHFNKKPFKCLQCNFGCNHKSYLNWHIKNSHPNIVITKLK